ncbi:MAG: bifunctional phosphopantothenoylcysteine decarboxylase/phosphopantothenate--cysteine ligase CoaBC [Christensenellaceae bacterium]|nr:bifunctional phosphopantothenoylcysteine decarboxylase/phosphopantothenate--cysteine ligase CoaBC [Christensenellaceae bacterium]
MCVTATQTIKEKCIVVGITGGIAAYKAATLVSLLKKAGADVHVVMSKNATQFITPLTLETLSKNRVVTDTFSRETPYEVSHVALNKKADLIVVAPATANIMAKAAHGIADDYLSTFLLAATCPVMFAPAMNTAMLHAPATRENMATLLKRGCQMISSASGMLACGDVGDGRMAEPEDIYKAILAHFAAKADFAGKKLLVTAGATRERIDDVRFLSNRSTGKMGYAIAKAAKERGAEVVLVSGPTALPCPAGVTRVDVESAQQMYEAVLAHFDAAHVVIKAAAVADYTPAEPQTGKIKKAGDMQLKLVRTRDILAELGSKKTHQVLIGFAAEAADLEENAQGKLTRKNLDMIAANDISRSDIGFGSEENCVQLYFADGRKKTVEKCPKEQVAHAILDEALSLMEK